MSSLSWAWKSWITLWTSLKKNQQTPSPPVVRSHGPTRLRKFWKSTPSPGSAPHRQRDNEKDRFLVHTRNTASSTVARTSTRTQCRRRTHTDIIKSSLSLSVYVIVCLCVSVYVCLSVCRPARFDSPFRFRHRAFLDQWVTSICPRGQPLFTPYTWQCFHMVLLVFILCLYYLHTSFIWNAKKSRQTSCHITAPG